MWVDALRLVSQNIQDGLKNSRGEKVDERMTTWLSVSCFPFRIVREVNLTAISPLLDFGLIAVSWSAL